MTLPRPPIPDRDYFNIGEACRIAQVPPHTLRYWESRFGALRPLRRESGHRRYTRRDVETILQIKELLHERKMTVAGAKRVMLNRLGSPAQAPVSGPASPALAKALREAREELRRILEEFR